jgi:glycosyltransferase involved in cell wall biosynthesis
VSGADVTVIVAAYNAASTIGATLASVGGQTVLPDRVVVADDASGDATAAVASRWSALLPLTILRLETNVGSSEARRRAIETTETDFLALLDADDLWLPDHLETMLATYRRSAGLVTAQPLNWVPGRGVASAPNRRYRGAPTDDDQLRKIVTSNFVFSSTMFSRRDYERAGGFRPSLRRSVDWDLWIRMLRDGVRVVRADHPTVLYRIQPGSLSFGYGNAESDVKVIQHALDDATGDAERRWARRSLRRLRARAALKQAFGLVQDGRPWPARMTAWRALEGAPRVALQAGAMMLAPRWTTRAYAERAAHPERQL